MYVNIRFRHEKQNSVGLPVYKWLRNHVYENVFGSERSGNRHGEEKCGIVNGSTSFFV